MNTNRTLLYGGLLMLSAHLSLTEPLSKYPFIDLAMMFFLFGALREFWRSFPKKPRQPRGEREWPRVVNIARKFEEEGITDNT